MAQLLSESKFNEIYDKALDLLNVFGVEFQSERILKVFQNNNFTIRGQRVHFTKSEVETALALLPKADYSDLSHRKVVASNIFGTVPVIFDDENKVHRRGDVSDIIKGYKFMSSSELYGTSHIFIDNPTGNDAPSPYLAQYAMLVKYMNKKSIVNGLRPQKGENGKSVYELQCEAFAFLKEFYSGEPLNPSIKHSVCPMSPLCYDDEALAMLTAVLDQDVNLGITPCTITALSGPYDILGVVCHDLAIALAGIVLVQLMKPGKNLSVGGASGVSDLRTIQPAYGTPETSAINTMIYECCRYLGIASGVGGAYSDADRANFQSGSEAFMSALTPFLISDVDVVGCNCGLLSGYYCGSFYKAVYDEEIIGYCNRIFKGFEQDFTKDFMKRMEKGIQDKGFLTTRTPREYRRDHYLTKCFSKYGVNTDAAAEKTNIELRAKLEIENRMNIYKAPELTDRQIRLIEPYLPSMCKDD